MSTVTSKQFIPTYIKAFLREDVECLLVYKKKLSAEFEEEWSFSSELKPSSNDVINESELDLTGNPLCVDLDESVKLVPSNNLITCITPHWTLTESQHFPLTLIEARSLLNSQFNKTKSPVPAFCVTDGSDNEKTVLIGGHNCGQGTTTYLGQIMGLHSFKEDELFLQTLRKEHDKRIMKADSTQYNFRRIYNIHGMILQEMPALEYSNYNGCFFLETSWNTFSEKEPDINETKMEIILKVISGHKDSSIHFLWDQLGYIQKYLKIITNQEAVNDDNTVLSDDYLSICDLTDQIHNLRYNKLKIKKNVNSEFLDFSHLREEKVMDKLWSLLSRCQHLKDLKCSLSNFFRVVNFENFDDSDSLLANLMRQCSITNEYISNLTYSESLKLLVYIGFEKLKQDYLAIINFYYPIHQAALDKNWRDFSIHNQQKPKKSKGIVKNIELIDTKFNEYKMDFLMRLHDTAEILTFLKRDVGSNFTLSVENFTQICKHVHQKYIFNKSNKQLETELKIKMLDITCELNLRNNKIYECKIPVTSIFEFTSKIHTSTLRTIFHLSQHPIFPKAIFDNYKLSGTDDYKLFGTDERSFVGADGDSGQLRYLSKLLVVN